METKNDNLTPKKSSENGKIHFILSNSYTIFLFAVVLGVSFDTIIPLNISIGGGYYKYVGLGMVSLGTLIIYWAQTTSNLIKSRKVKEGTHPGFDYGPYKYLRSPTHSGLFIMTLGLAVIINSPFSFLFVIIAHIITKLIYIKKEEKMLEEKYGEAYRDYKNKTKNFI